MGEKTVITSTATLLRTALTIMGMHRSSLEARNPYEPVNRAWVMKMIESAQRGVLYTGGAPAPGACALVVKGITGTRKSITVKRVLKMLGPQVIHHGPDDDARWKQATQLNYLYVAISHDGSRGGLLSSILLAVDAALGTDYSVKLPKQYPSIEKLVGAVIALLHSNYIGVLVIDEIQLLNMYLADQATLMQLLLLNLLNSGIPTVLVGNPLGFIGLAELSQDASRLVERPQVYFHPCGAVGPAEDDEWDEVWPGIRGFYVLDEPPSDEEACKQCVKRCSGGIPRLGLALWTNTQASALLDDRSSIGAQDLVAEFQKEDFDALRGVCEGFSNKDPLALLPWRGIDIPVDYYARVWGKPLPSEQPTSEIGASGGTARTTAAKKGTKAAGSGAARMKARETKRKKREIAIEAAKSALPSEDMRMSGLQSHALASLAELMGNLGTDKQPSGSS